MKYQENIMNEYQNNMKYDNIRKYYEKKHENSMFIICFCLQSWLVAVYVLLFLYQ